MSDSGGSWLDTAYGLLSTSQRRYALYYFLNNEDASLDELVEEISEWESDVAPESIRIALHHNHLPQLAEHGIVEYVDSDIRVTSKFDALRSTVAQARAIEDDSRSTQSPLMFGSGSESVSEPVSED
ncbi:hypothetical protein C500_00612 [Natrialba magadii ATCC 43099]|nr:hypothetical protein [Natrialba magadii]ELY34391.1 hypothetical protein C500_00612 [Natrialba magadii ATCC 43099]